MITAGFSEAASTIAAGERALKIISLVGKIEEEGGVLADAIKAVTEAIRSLRGVLEALKDIKGVATVAKLAKTGAEFTAFSTALEDPGAYQDPGEITEILTEGALLGVGFGMMGKALGKGLRELSPAALRMFSASLGRDSGDLLESPGLSAAEFKKLPHDEQIRIAEAEIAQGTLPFGSDADAAHYGSDTWNHYAENLSPEEKQAIFDYTKEPPHSGPTYKEINAYLRGDASHGTSDVLHDVSEIDKAMAGKTVPDNIIVVRGTDLGHIPMDPDQMVGKSFPEHAYVSTSLGKNPVSSFSGKEAVMHWHVPAGTPAIYVEKVSAFGGGERELLLGRGTQYKVGRVIRFDNQWHIYGEIMPG